MTELMLHAAKLMPEKDLFIKLRQAIQQWEQSQNDKHKDIIFMYCTLLVVKDTTKDREVKDCLREADEIKSIHERLKGKHN